MRPSNPAEKSISRKIISSDMVQRYMGAEKNGSLGNLHHWISILRLLGPVSILPNGAERAAPDILRGQIAYIICRLYSLPSMSHNHTDCLG